MKLTLPDHWNHAGLVIARSTADTGGVVGDPCIVWDEEIAGWRMFLFVEKPGVGEAICREPNNVGPGQWAYLGPLRFSNPQDLIGGHTHKPYVITDADQPNHAACIDGRYWLVTVSTSKLDGSGRKIVQRATSESLAGPWTLDKAALIDVGGPSDFDAKHVDAVTGFYFADRGAVLYFYMGYPEAAQPRATSPYGSAQAAAVQRVGETHATKLGIVLPPCETPRHWASGWVGGLQIVPGVEHRWIALVNASPTPPHPTISERWREEPPPSLGGFAYCDEAWPVKNWHWYPEPIERIEDLPPQAIADGEGVNLWRHHLLVLPDGRMAIFYNSGSYGTEQLYMKVAE